MKILYFIGEGYGFMAGIKEYVVFVDDDADEEEEAYPGFELKSVTDIGNLPSSFPVNTTLIPKN